MSATTEQLSGSIPLMRRSSLALDNLRAFVILLVLSFHSVLAYLQFLPAAPYPFDSPPYQWRVSWLLTATTVCHPSGSLCRLISILCLFWQARQ